MKLNRLMATANLVNIYIAKGVAVYDGKSDYEKVFKNADKEMYENKAKIKVMR